MYKTHIHTYIHTYIHTQDLEALQSSLIKANHAVEAHRMSMATKDDKISELSRELDSLVRIRAYMCVCVCMCVCISELSRELDSLVCIHVCMYVFVCKCRYICMYEDP